MTMADRAASTPDAATLLSGMDLFGHLSSSELAQLASVAVPRTYSKGEVIFHEGTRGEVLYVIRSGRVTIKRDHPDGRTVSLADFTPGQIFGELAVFDDEVRSATAECAEDTQTIALMGSDLRRVLRRNPEMALKLLSSLSKRLRAASSRIESQYFQGTEARVAAVVLRLAETQAPEGVGANRHVTATQSEIAQLASTSRETVSRFLAGLEREGVLRTFRGRLEILDGAALQRFVS